MSNAKISRLEAEVDSLFPKMDETFPLSELSRRLKDLTGGRVTYESLYIKVLDDDLPAEKNLAGRWRVKCADVPAIAAKLGLMGDAK